MFGLKVCVISNPGDYFMIRIQHSSSLSPVDKSHAKSQNTKVMCLADLYGHANNKDAELGFVERILLYLDSLPLKGKPDVVIVSGLIYGGYKQKKSTHLHPEAMPEDMQLSKAKEFIEKLQEMGITVIYNKADIIKLPRWVWKEYKHPLGPEPWRCD